jgi:predicted transcriptional regulator
MKIENVMYFTEREEVFVDLLIGIGFKRNVARVLVFIANIPEATSHEIERGTDLRQPEVSIAMMYLITQGWISSRDSKAGSKGRPLKIYRLAQPLNGILDTIEKNKEKEASAQIARLRKLREYID